MPEVNERTRRLLDALGQTAEALQGVSDDDRAAYKGGVEIVERVIAYAQIVIDQTDPDLITDAALNAIESSANSITNNLGAALGNPRSYVDPS